MIPKIYKRCAIGFVLLTFILIPFFFWMGGWNLQRNEAGGACIFFSLVISVAGSAIIMSIGNESRDS